MNFNELLKIKRKEKKLTQDELAKKLGIARISYVRYENGDRYPAYDVLKKMSEILEISFDNIVSNEFTDTKMNVSNDIVKLPVKILGTASCGNGKDNNQNFYEEEYYIPKEWLRLSEDNYFLGYASGDSMINANIRDGSLLLFKKQTTLENNQIGLFHLNECEYIKRLKIYDNGIIALFSENLDYEPIFVSENDIFEVRGLVLKEITTIEKE